jgi:hypothetical protein
MGYRKKIALKTYKHKKKEHCLRVKYDSSKSKGASPHFSHNSAYIIPLSEIAEMNNFKTRLYALLKQREHNEPHAGQALRYL